MKNFSIIAAVDEKLGIGINNQLPWQLSKDLKHFSEITVGEKNNVVIMGLNTWHSLPEKFRPLKNRLNIVLSKEKEPDLPADVLNYQSLEDALTDLENKNINEIFIIGGGMLYSYSIKQPACNKLHLTEVLGNFECDTYFPEIPADFKKLKESETFEENGVKFRFTVWEK